jgi:alkanesulfonate monooxygenase SsuD/methylene tetrahydromethanopterin reductase-like flavin-dependent oxidoreductase (luciferase family)
VWAIAADSDEEAERLASSIAMSFAMLRQGRPIPVPPPEKALRFLAQHGDPGSGRRRIVGSPETVRAGIEAVAEEYGADEVIVVTITHDHGARRRSYELIAEAFGLARPKARAA